MKAESRLRREPEPRKIRFVLSEVAVRRLRAADRLMTDLFAKLYREAPAWLVNDVAEAHLAITEAVNEIGRCCVENDPAPDGGSADGHV